MSHEHVSRSQPGERWRVCVDAGGTFNDFVATSTSGEQRVTKVLSGPDAVARGLTELFGEASRARPWPSIDLRMGTTAGTNALLERRGAKVVWVTNRGFGDMLEIGDQTRPDLFALDIVRPPTLVALTVEVDARCDADGVELVGLDQPAADQLAQTFAKAKRRGADSVAIALIHAHRNPTHELALAQLARAAGFAHVSCSHAVAHSAGWLARAETTVVDAYLSPVLAQATGSVAALLHDGAGPDSTLAFMRSNGGLAAPDEFFGRDCVLSGPAGGVVAVAQICDVLGIDQAIGFDMGGTSTDVCRYAGQLERSYDTRVGGHRIRVPMLELHTVAAGGGSICAHDGPRLTVGPASAGSQPGPLAYGRDDAIDLTVTDLNVHLGRVVPERFPFALSPARVEPALRALASALDRDDLPPDELARGLLRIANEAMAGAIRRITVGRGHDPREHALVVFGGAGGQHACAVAERLGITRIVQPPLGGVLSAWGIGQAQRTRYGQRDLGRRALETSEAAFAALRDQAEHLRGTLYDRPPLDRPPQDGPDSAFIRGRAAESMSISLAYAQSQAEIELLVDDIDFGDDNLVDLRRAFDEAHAQRFGYARPEAVVELRRLVLELRETKVGQPKPEPQPQPQPQPKASAGAATHTPVDWPTAPRLEREALDVDEALHGPTLIHDPTSTFVLEPGWSARLVDVAGLGRCVIAERNPVLVTNAPEGATDTSADTSADPVRLELFLRRFDDIATEMGVVLERTAVSTNIRDRMDFSCAVFDADGELVANAPHIPVHLGAMSETVRAVAAAHPDAAPGDAYVSNDPAAGGSHLPDITVVNPVFDAAGQLTFFVASRGHHADIGGITPGSMPPNSTSLDQEGIVLRAVPLVRGGQWLGAELRERLRQGPYPCRRPDEVIADLRAQLAANARGIALLQAMCAQQGLARVQHYMRHIQDYAAQQVQARIREKPDGVYRFDDALDDGTRICTRIDVTGERMRIDFSDSADQHPGNLNAPRAVAVAAVLYVMRAWVGRPIPLNAGCLRAIDLVLRPGSVLAPGPEAAVVAGNVETSQRVVDVLLGALGLAAASQGTMNNLSFGVDGGVDADASESERAWGYYETLGGGAGATATAPGASAVHTHMTNTRLTDVELLEARYPVRLLRSQIRRGSGGEGPHAGGDGMVREYLFTAPLSISLLSERRARAPFGLGPKGGAGAPGQQFLDGEPLPGRVAQAVQAGQVLRIETPGGGAYDRELPELPSTGDA